MFPSHDQGKGVNFGLAYGSEGHNLVKTVTWKDENGKEHPLTWDLLNDGMISFKRRFHGMMDYLASIPDIARAQGGVYCTPFGRERRMGNKLNDKNKGIRKAAEREIVNFSIQSVAGAITIRTLNIIHDWILQWRANGLPIEDLWLLNTVHDSGAWNVVDDKIMFFARSLEKAATRPIPELKNYEFPCDIGVGKSLTACEEKENKIKWT